MISVEIPKHLLGMVMHFPDALAVYVYNVQCPTQEMITFMEENAQHLYSFHAPGLKNPEHRGQPVLIEGEEGDICLFRLRFGF